MYVQSLSHNEYYTLYNQIRSTWWHQSPQSSDVSRVPADRLLCSARAAAPHRRRPAVAGGQPVPEPQRLGGGGPSLPGALPEEQGEMFILIIVMCCRRCYFLFDMPVFDSRLVELFHIDQFLIIFILVFFIIFIFVKTDFCVLPLLCQKHWLTHGENML